MSDLIEFLRARLTEDEEVAANAAGLGASRRHWTREAISCVVGAADNRLIVYGEGTPTPEQADHIARFDPARVLAEVESKLRLVDLCEMQSPAERYDGSYPPLDIHEVATVALRLLAVPYAGHPDYSQGWRP